MRVYLGVYLCFSGIFYLTGALWLARLRRRLGGYSARAWVASLLALAAFEALSIWADLVPVRKPGSFSYPGDYLSAGLVGWGIMLLLPAGFLAPILIAAWTAHHTPRP